MPADVPVLSGTWISKHREGYRGSGAIIIVIETELSTHGNIHPVSVSEDAVFV